MKIVLTKINPLSIALVVVLIITLGGAIYAATTWNLDASNKGTAASKAYSTLKPSSSVAPAAIKVQASDPAAVTSNTNSNQLQAPTSENVGQNTQTSASSSGPYTDYNAPPACASTDQNKQPEMMCPLNE